MRDRESLKSYEKKPNTQIPPSRWREWRANQLLEDLSREDLLTLIEVYAKAWQAMDGAYFLSLEEKFGIETAMEMDMAAWRIFSPIEAKRIVREFDIPENGGLPALEKALGCRVYAVLNDQETEWKDDQTLIFRMKSCRVQVARNRKGLPDFPCKPVGTIEYEEFAATIDPRIKTECVYCPPDEHPEGSYCQWEFTMEE